MRLGPTGSFEFGGKDIAQIFHQFAAIARGNQIDRGRMLSLLLKLQHFCQFGKLASYDTVRLLRTRFCVAARRVEVLLQLASKRRQSVEGCLVRSQKVFVSGQNETALAGLCIGQELQDACSLDSSVRQFDPASHHLQSALVVQLID